MTHSEMAAKVKSNLQLKDNDRDLLISDITMAVYDYCNLCPECIPDTLEPFIRKKVKGILDYEDAKGTGYQPEVQSIKDGDGSITWAQTEGNTKASIYELNESDKKYLRRHRRLRGYG